MFEILEHTADIGLKACGATAEEMFEQAALALESIVLETEDVQGKAEYPVAAQGEDWESLLVNWLSEVLYYMDGEHVALSRFRIDSLCQTRITARAWGEPRDPARHPPRLVVKGVTYHELRVTREPGNWCAEVYVDI